MGAWQCSEECLCHPAGETSVTAWATCRAHSGWLLASLLPGKGRDTLPQEQLPPLAEVQDPITVQDLQMPITFPMALVIH